MFYAVAYTFLVIGSFGVLSIVSGEGDRGTSLDHLDGLGTRRPALALALTVFLLAQAGVPLTSGFLPSSRDRRGGRGPLVLARYRCHGHGGRVGVPLLAHHLVGVPRSAEDDAPTIRVPRAAGLAIIVAP